MKTIVRTLALGVLCALALGTAAFAADGETLYNAEYCFCEADFHADTMTDLSGIFVTGVPEEAVAAVRLGQRVIQSAFAHILRHDVDR